MKKKKHKMVAKAHFEMSLSQKMKIKNLERELKDIRIDKNPRITMVVGGWARWSPEWSSGLFCNIIKITARIILTLSFFRPNWKNL